LADASPTCVTQNRPGDSRLGQDHHQVAERIRHPIERCVVDIDRAQMRLSVSIGAAERVSESTLTDLVANADTAMYEATRGGGAAVHATA
jgi:GGDEF domain-containing protein